MIERSQAARRAAQIRAGDFPASPTLPRDRPCNGLAFLLDAAVPMPGLRSLRNDIDTIRRGAFGIEADRDLVVVTFARPLLLEPDRWPGALLLIATPSGTLRSFVKGGDLHSEVPHVVPPPPYRWVELWWNGGLGRVAVETLAPVPVAALWDLPGVTVQPAAPIASPVMQPRSVRAPVGSARTRIARATVPMAAGGPDLMADMARRLRESERHPRLAALGRGARDGLVSALALILAPLLGLGAVLGAMLGVAGTGWLRPAPSAAARRPGLGAALLAWVRWRTPLGTALKRQFGNRLQQVEKLIAAGDLDGALRLALRLGSDKPGKKPPTRYPSQLPAARATLDFDLAPALFVSPILADAALHQVRQRYVALAERLERDGDFRRAAYIYSQLLDYQRRAVLVLEKGGLFADAAKLALGAKLEAPLTIRMLFKAGQLETALAIAKRTATFEQLAEDSRGKHAEYHAYVLKAWTEMLLATGQPLRALQVTDALAQHDADVALLAARRKWLMVALDAAEDDAFGVELAARALLTASWTAADIDPRGIEAFPQMAGVTGAGCYPAVLDWLQKRARGDGPDAGESLIDIVGAMIRIAAPEQREQVAFWHGPGQTMLERLARAVVAVAGALDQSDLQALQLLLRKARLSVLAADLGKLRALHAAAKPKRSEWEIAPPEVVRPAIRVACQIGNGAMLIWRENAMLELLDRFGTPLWRQSFGEVVGLVAIGSSPHVIVIQADENGGRVLTRFESNHRSFHPIGSVDLRAHHDLTSESQWLVQIGGEIGGLDLAQLCAALPVVEFAWSCALTDRLQALAFTHQPDGRAWLTVDTSPDRAGLIEMWTLRSTGALETHICLPAVSPNSPVPGPGSWFWDTQSGHGRIGSIDEPRRWMSPFLWNEQAEDRARTLLRQRAAAGIGDIDRFQACDFGRPFVRATSGPEREDGSVQRDACVIAFPAAAPAMTLRYDAARPLVCLARGKMLLFGDDVGRLVILDATKARLTVL
jgi:hypothetical protein